MSTGQLWQQARLKTLDEMIGNQEAIAAFRQIESGFVLVEGQIGTGKTSTALAWAREKYGVPLEEMTAFACPGSYYVRHCHASEFNIDDVMVARQFFNRATPTCFLVDEAQDLKLKLQQSRLKTIPSRTNLTLVLITSEPEQIESSIRDRCARIRLGSLSARDLQPMVQRACALRGIPFSNEIVPALNRAGVFRPRAVLNVVDAIARGLSPAQAVVGQ